MLLTLDEWSAAFWDELVLVDELLCHYTFTGDTKAHHIVIDANVLGDGGVVRVSRYHGGAAVRRFPFRLADPPAKLAAEVAALVVPARDAPSDVLTAMRRPEFLRVIRRAELQAASADNVRTVLLRWAARLLPHLERDHDLTVAEALARYRSEQRSKR
jgi:hypothetical protein